MQNTAIREEYITLGNKTSTIETILEEAEEIQKYCSDYTIAEVPNNVRFEGNTLNLKYLAGDYKVNTSPLSPYALSQLCIKLGIPYRYILKCIEKGQTDLVAENINSWLDEYKGSFLVREYKNEIRGILSSRYCAFDTPKILDVFSNVSKNVGDFEIRGYYLSPERFHLRVTETTPLDIMNETLFCGFTIDSSDVGRKTLTISFFVYRQVCTNGLCISKFNDVLYSQKHMGINSAEFSAGVVESFAKFPILKDAAHKMILGSMSKSLPANFRGITRLEDLSQKVQNSLDISEKTAENIVYVWDNLYGGTDSLWAYTNAITEVARDMTLENRLTLERKAGVLLASSVA